MSISKTIKLETSNQYTFLFEVDKKEGDDGMRKSSNTYRIVQVQKNRAMTFTCPKLKELVNRYQKLQEEAEAK